MQKLSDDELKYLLERLLYESNKELNRKRHGIVMPEKEYTYVRQTITEMDYLESSDTK